MVFSTTRKLKSWNPQSYTVKLFYCMQSLCNKSSRNISMGWSLIILIMFHFARHVMALIKGVHVFCRCFSRGLGSWPITEVNTEVLKRQLPGKRCLSRFWRAKSNWVGPGKQIPDGDGWRVILFSFFCRSTTWRIPLKWCHEAFGKHSEGECSNIRY